MQSDAALVSGAAELTAKVRALNNNFLECAATHSAKVVYSTFTLFHNGGVLPSTHLLCTAALLHVHLLMPPHLADGSNSST